MSTTTKPVAPSVQPQQKAKSPDLADTPTGSNSAGQASSNVLLFRQQPEDLDVTRNNEATNEFQAKTVELRNQRPQWITYYQLVETILNYILTAEILIN